MSADRVAALARELRAWNDLAVRLSDVAGIDEALIQLNGLRRQLETELADADDSAPDDPLAQMWVRNPVGGVANPLAPPLELAAAEGEARGRVRLGSVYAGWPDLAHGGLPAMVLDHALGAANWSAGHPAVTSTLEVRYHRPVPLHRDLVVQARCVEVAGRWVTVEGELVHEEVVLVAATGHFVKVSEETRQRLLGANGS